MCAAAEELTFHFASYIFIKNLGHRAANSPLSTVCSRGVQIPHTKMPLHLGNFMFLCPSPRSRPFSCFCCLQFFQDMRFSDSLRTKSCIILFMSSYNCVFILISTIKHILYLCSLFMSESEIISKLFQSFFILYFM